MNLEKMDCGGANRIQLVQYSFLNS